MKKNGNVQRKRQTKVIFQKSRKNREILKSTKSNDVQTSFKECKVKKSVKKQHALFELRTYTGTYNTVTINEIKMKSLNVPGDGNCFFHSLSLSINGDFEQTHYYRLLICNYILNNWDLRPMQCHCIMILA